MSKMVEGRKFGIWMTIEGAGKFLLGHGPIKFLREPVDESGPAAVAASNLPAALRALADYIEMGVIVDEDNITIHFGPEGERR